MISGGPWGVPEKGPVDTQRVFGVDDSGPMEELALVIGWRLLCGGKQKLEAGRILDQVQAGEMSPHTAWILLGKT